MHVAFTRLFSRFLERLLRAESYLRHMLIEEQYRGCKGAKRRIAETPKCGSIWKFGATR